jgi:hypothetical protein
MRLSPKYRTYQAQNSTSQVQQFCGFESKLPLSTSYVVVFQGLPRQSS